MKLIMLSKHGDCISTINIEEHISIVLKIRKEHDILQAKNKSLSVSHSMSGRVHIIQ